MLSAALLLAVSLTLAWANGSNDVSSKGVAALAGSGIATPRAAWPLGVFATFAGGLGAIPWGGTLGALFALRTIQLAWFVTLLATAALSAVLVMVGA